MGEGLKADEARDATFLLTGAGTWVGKSAYLTADPMTLQEGKRAITHAILDHGVKARGPGHPRVNLLAQLPFRFTTSGASPLGNQSMQRFLMIGRSSSSPLGVVAIIGGGEAKDNKHPDINPLCQTEVSKVTGVQSPWHLPGHPGQTVQMVLGI